MLPNFHFNETEILAFSLVLLRISAFVVSWPVFSVYSVPNHLKVLLSLCIAFLLFPVIDKTGLDAQKLGQDVTWLAGKEVLTGLCLGFLTRTFFFALSAGGNLVATSIGLANGQIFNPALGQQSTTVEQFYVTVGTLLFLALNGHHFFLTGLASSFEAIPLMSAGTDLASLNTVKGAGGGGITTAIGIRESGAIVQSVVESGIKIAAPVLVVLFMLNVAMGILGRAVPQINVLVTSMSVNVMAGLLVMIISVPALLLELDHQFVAFAEQVFRLMKMF